MRLPDSRPEDGLPASNYKRGYQASEKYLDFIAEKPRFKMEVNIYIPEKLPLLRCYHSGISSIIHVKTSRQQENLQDKRWIEMKQAVWK